jgi:signal transduction histidine kinase/DNA-binding response OmpR family regulator/HAMP domain-containing protein
MKITYRILIINFAIVFLVIGSAAFAFYSIMYSVLTSQHSKYLLNSTNDFIYVYRESIDNTEEDFLYLLKNGINQKFSSEQLFEKNIDFIFKTNPSNVILNKSYKENVYLPDKLFSLDKFLTDNPFAVTKTYKNEDSSTYYYGRIIDSYTLNGFSKRIGADIALVLNNSISQSSNESQNQKFLFSLNKAYKDLALKNNFEVFSQKDETTDILVALCKPSSNVEDLNNNFQFLVFTTLNEAVDLRSSLKNILIIIGFSGILISLILTILFTDKIRKQISDLSKATEVIKTGNFQNKISIKSKDEIGELATAFNLMVTELEKNQKSKNEYSDFITMLNQNPSLKEISDAALDKIINICGFIVGALYTVEEDGIKIASSFGIEKGHSSLDSNFINDVIHKRELIELEFNENPPSIKTGVIKVDLKYLTLVPILYNNKVIAILELCGADKPGDAAKDYLSNIQEQLAIGLTNAIAFVQLEKLVMELKQLNEDYQKQNIQIRKQNETLVDLHKKLKEKAEELEIQKQKAEESTKLKSQFLASMSHELRTPMNSILGLTELMLEESNLIGKNRERIEVVLRSGKRLMNLINDILDLSKIEAGKMELHEENMLLDDLIKEVEHSVSPLFKNKKIEFRVIKDTHTSIIINTDRGKVMQVLINLLGNAIKFTESGYVELKISAAENKELLFIVTDTGIGIIENDQKVIFDEFRQVDGTITKKYGGTGLGLTICKKIADLLQGSISVSSKPGIGSSFTFTIPLNFIEKIEQEGKPRLNVEKLLKNRENPILVIDDNQGPRDTIGQYLTSRSYEVIYAENGEQGINEAIKRQPLLIVLNIMLTQKDGWRILQKLKNNSATIDIPIILVSMLGDKNIGYDLGALEYLFKPFNSELLFTTITKLEKMAKKRIKKVTIVDDDELEFENFKNEFKNKDIRVDYIKESELAFSRILETQPDLIIIDLMMPKVDGVTLTNKLKTNRETKHIPIIFSTTKNITEEENDTLNNIVERITIQIKGHPLDILKIIRDRITSHEFYLASENKMDGDEQAPSGGENFLIEEIKRNYIGQVLVVDDDPDTLFTINEILESCNCKAYLVKGGKECLNMLEQVTPDIILLDIMMPEMDGFQTINKIKMHPKWAHIPVFAVTAKAMLEDKEVILRNGFDDYVPKPINAGILSMKIKQVFMNLKLS